MNSTIRNIGIFLVLGLYFVCVSNNALTIKSESNHRVNRVSMLLLLFLKGFVQI